MARTDAIEKDGPGEPPKKKPEASAGAADEDVGFVDSRGCVFRGLSGDPDEDDDCPAEPPGFDPIKSRYLEGMPARREPRES